MEQNQQLKALLVKDFNKIFDDLDLFIECIPYLAKMVNQDEFIEYVGLKYHTVNRRFHDPNLWKIEELRKAKDFFVNYNLGKKEV